MRKNPAGRSTERPGAHGRIRARAGRSRSIDRVFRPPRGLRSPAAIQDYLTRLPYDEVKGTRSPYWVARERKANCFEGALFAAAALRALGYPPLVMDLYAVNDDDHVIAVYRKRGKWGALAKSNTTTLRDREPVYRTLRELVMSYFDGYFNIFGVKSLRSYARPANLARFDKVRWMTTDEDLVFIGDYLNGLPHTPIVTPGEARLFRRVDPDQIKAGFLTSVKKGLYPARAPR